MVEVVAALIWNEAHDEILLCKRAAHKARGGMWEFVGGKVEAGERKEAALIRECEEELAVTLSVEEAVMDVTHVYPDLTVHLTLFAATIARGEPQMLEHEAIEWVRPSSFYRYGFCPADQEIVDSLNDRGYFK